jgi:hypothetical protein
VGVPRTIAEVLAEHVTLEVESIDRIYLNVYVPALQRDLAEDLGGMRSKVRARA